MTESRPVRGCSWLSNVSNWEPEWNRFLVKMTFKMTGFRILLRRRA